MEDNFINDGNTLSNSVQYAQFMQEVRQVYGSQPNDPVPGSTSSPALQMDITPGSVPTNSQIAPPFLISSDASSGSGVVSQLCDTFGYVNNDVYFDYSVVNGRIPKVGETVMMKCEFKEFNQKHQWFATSVTVLPFSSLTSISYAESTNLSTNDSEDGGPPADLIPALNTKEADGNTSRSGSQERDKIDNQKYSDYRRSNSFPLCRKSTSPLLDVDRSQPLKVDFERSRSQRSEEESPPIKKRRSSQIVVREESPKIDITAEQEKLNKQRQRVKEREKEMLILMKEKKEREEMQKKLLDILPFIEKIKELEHQLETERGAYTEKEKESETEIMRQKKKLKEARLRSKEELKKCILLKIELEDERNRTQNAERELVNQGEKRQAEIEMLKQLQIESKLNLKQEMKHRIEKGLELLEREKNETLREMENHIRGSVMNRVEHNKPNLTQAKLNWVAEEYQIALEDLDNCRKEIVQLEREQRSSAVMKEIEVEAELLGIATVTDTSTSEPTMENENRSGRKLKKMKKKNQNTLRELQRSRKEILSLKENLKVSEDEYEKLLQKVTVFEVKYDRAVKKTTNYKNKLKQALSKLHTAERRKKDADCPREELQNRLDESEADAIRFKDRAGKAESKLESAEGGLKQAEYIIRGLRRRHIEAERRNKHAEAHAKEMKVKFTEIEKRTEEFVNQLKDLKCKLTEAQNRIVQAKDAKCKLATTESQTDFDGCINSIDDDLPERLESESKELRAALCKVENRAFLAEIQAKESRDKLDEANKQANLAETEAEQLKCKLRVAECQLEQVASSLDCMKVQLNESENRSRHAESRAVFAETMLADTKFHIEHAANLQHALEDVENRIMQAGDEAENVQRKLVEAELPQNHWAFRQATSNLIDCNALPSCDDISDIKGLNQQSQTIPDLDTIFAVGVMDDAASVFTNGRGVVTAIFEESGYINNILYFNFRIVEGSLPEIGDDVDVGVVYCKSMSFPWKAVKVLLADQSEAKTDSFVCQSRGFELSVSSTIQIASCTGEKLEGLN